MSISGFEFDYEVVASLAEDLNAVMDKVHKYRSSSYIYHLRCLIAAKNLLLNKYLPIKKGDRVKLVKNVNIDDAPGWAGCKHFLVKGALATVANVEVRCSVAKQIENYEESIAYDLIFDNESYIDHNGQLCMTEEDHKHTFCFGESMLEKLD